MYGRKAYARGTYGGSVLAGAPTIPLTTSYSGGGRQSTSLTILGLVPLTLSYQGGGRQTTTLGIMGLVPVVTNFSGGGSYHGLLGKFGLVPIQTHFEGSSLYGSELTTPVRHGLSLDYRGGSEVTTDLTLIATHFLTTSFSGGAEVSTWMDVTQDFIITGYQGSSRMLAFPHVRLPGYETTFEFVVDSTASLSLDVGVQTPPEGIETIETLGLSQTMRRPARVRGRPIHPKAHFISSSSGSAAGTVYPPPPPDPLPEPPPRPKSFDLIEGLPGFKFRWLAEDLVGSIGSPTSSWPEHHGVGPSWTSPSGSRPSVVRYRNASRNISYHAAVRFNWDNVEFMRLDLGSNKSQPMTMVLVCAVMGTQTANLHTHILDGHDSFNHRRMLHVRPTQLQMEGRAGAASVASGVLSGSARYTNRMAVYSGVFAGSNSRFRVQDKGGLRQITGNAGSGGHRGFNLGKQWRKSTRYWASQMMVVEILYFESNLNLKSQYDLIYKYANSEYTLSRW